MSRPTDDSPNPTTRHATVFVKFTSHRSRDYGLREIGKRQSYFSTKRKTGYGVYPATYLEIQTLRKCNRARFTILRAPYEDLMECWTI